MRTITIVHATNGLLLIIVTKDRLYMLKTYKTTEEVRLSVSDYIEFFYNPKRKYKHLKELIPNQFENM